MNINEELIIKCLRELIKMLGQRKYIKTTIKDKQYMDVYMDSDILHYQIGTVSGGGIYSEGGVTLLGSHSHILCRVPRANQCY